MYKTLYFVQNFIMKTINNKKLIKILLIMLIIMVGIIIIKECKFLGICCTILTLMLPIFFGFTIAWIIKPIMLFFNKHFNLYISAFITYSILALLIFGIGYFLIPIFINEIKNLIPSLISFYEKVPVNVKSNININEIGKNLLNFFNRCTSNIKNIILSVFYSLFISYFFLIDHQKISMFISKHTPNKLINDISLNLKAFVKGTLLDTVILFILSLISFLIIKLPYSLLFAIIISITNIIPYIGPYIGGIPTVIVALSVNSRIGIIALIIVVILQFIESSFIHPIIMSKSLKLNPILIILGLIFCSYFWGIIGMIISTPLVSIIKSCYLYYYKDLKKLH